MSKKTKTDPTMKTVYQLTKDSMDSGIASGYPHVDIEFDKGVLDGLDELCEIYGFDREVVINGILSVEVNRLKDIEDEK